MQNMKNAVLVLTAFLLLFPYKLMAENKVISIEDGWNIEDERSISFAPQLSIDEQNIYIYSEKELNDLEVIIKDSLGNVIYYNVSTVSECTTYPIDITKRILHYTNNRSKQLPYWLYSYRIKLNMHLSMIKTGKGRYYYISTTSQIFR